MSVIEGGRDQYLEDSETAATTAGSAGLRLASTWSRRDARETDPEAPRHRRQPAEAGRVARRRCARATSRRCECAHARPGSRTRYGRWSRSGSRIWTPTPGLSGPQPTTAFSLRPNSDGGSHDRLGSAEVSRRAARHVHAGRSSARWGSSPTRARSARRTSRRASPSASHCSTGLYAFADVSGGHFNPAVSLAMFLDKRSRCADMIGYWVAQFAGAMLGSLCVLIAFNQNAVARTATLPGPTGAGPRSFLELVFDGALRRSSSSIRRRPNGTRARHSSRSR